MQEAKIVLIIVLLIVLVNGVRGDFKYHILHTFPFLGGQRPGIYDAAGVGMIIIFLFGWAHLNRIRDRNKREKKNQWNRR